MDLHSKRTLSLITQVLKKHIWIFIGFILVNIILSLADVVIPYFLKLQLDYLQNQSLQLPFISNHGTVFLVLLLIPALIELLRLSFFEKMGIKFDSYFSHQIKQDLQRVIWQKMKRFDLGFFQTGRNQHLIRSALDSTSLLTGAINFVREQFDSLITFMALIPLLYLIHYKILLLIFVAAILQLVISELRRKLSLGQQFVDTFIQDKSYVIQQVMEEDFGLIKEIGASQQIVQRLFDEQDKSEKIALEKTLHNRSVSAVNWLIDNLFLIIANLLIAQQIFAGEVSLGTFTLTISYIKQINNALYRLLNIKESWQSFNLDFLKLSFIINLKSRLKISKKNLRVKSPRSLELKNVGFTYPSFYEDEKKFMTTIVDDLVQQNQKRQSYHIQQELNNWRQLVNTPSSNNQVLNKVSLKVEQGKITALLGRNGSGKTTITKLLMHSYEVDSGNVLLNNQLINDYQPGDLSQSFAYLQQSPFLLTRFSLRDNLLLGVRRRVNDEEIWQTLDKLGLKSTVLKLTKGLDSILEEDISFSGGQQQLLVIVRALLQKRPFIIFDEGSSQLDIEKETQILKLLQEEKLEAGILFITHRITVARKADQIYFLDQGQIQEEGTHQELIKNKGLYHQFWKLQVIE